MKFTRPNRWLSSPKYIEGNKSYILYIPSHINYQQFRHLITVDFNLK
jgi:hypothetical protein